MTTQKTRPTDASVTEFLDRATPAQRRIDGHALAALCTEVTGVEPVMWGPSIVGYGETELFSGSTGKSVGTWPVVAFSPRKAALTLYGLKDASDRRDLLPRLGTFTEGAGCVYVKQLEDVDLGVLRTLLEMTWTEHA